MTRGGIGPTVVIWLDELTYISLSVGPADVVTSKLVWLKVLNDSQRNRSPYRSEICQFLVIAVSAELRYGVLKRLREVLLKVPTALLVNALMLT